MGELAVARPMNGRLRELRERIHSEQHRPGILLLLLFTLIGAFLTSLAVGAMPISIGQSLSILAHNLGIALPWPYTQTEAAVLESIRIPRAVLAILVGGALAVSGAAMQGLFRNPLADPGIIGVSSGAALAAVMIIVLGTTWFAAVFDQLGSYLLPIAAFLGGFLTTLLVYRLSSVSGSTMVASMLLAGIAINAVANAGTGLLTYMADDTQLRTLTFWTMGSLGGASWSSVMGIAPFILIPLVLIPRYARALNAISLGESEAFHLGFELQKIKLQLIILVAMAVGGSVAAAGIIGFVGLVTPHLLRMAFGPDHRFLLPASALLGASLLMVADLISRIILAPAELPIGIITALLGGPFFLWLLVRQRTGRGW